MCIEYGTDMATDEMSMMAMMVMALQVLSLATILSLRALCLSKAIPIRERAEINTLETYNHKYDNCIVSKTKYCFVADFVVVAIFVLFSLHTVTIRTSIIQKFSNLYSNISGS